MTLSAIGDALGWITEFEKNNSSLYKKFGLQKINQFIDWEKKVGGRFYGFIDKIKAGSYSDDTQLSLSVSRSIENDGKINNLRFSKIELPGWLYYARGGGRTIKVASDKISRKSAKWNNNFFHFKIGDQQIDYRDCGANGVAMRVLPIALANIGQSESIKKNIFSNAIITHGHARAHIGAIIYGLLVNELFKHSNNQFSPIDFLADFGKNFKDNISMDFNKYEGIPEWIEKWNKDCIYTFENHYKSICSEVLGVLQELYRALRNEVSCEKVLRSIGCFRSDTKSSGTITVLASLYIFLHHNKDPKAGIVNAVNYLGSDTDSIAGFAGGLYGALYGDSIIPEEWYLVQDIDYLTTTAEMLHSINVGDEQHTNSLRSEVISSLPSFYSSKTSMLELKKDNFEIGDEINFEPIGKGTVLNIRRLPVLTQGKLALVRDIQFDVGQLCRFSTIIPS